MKKINYTLDDNNYIISYQAAPFDKNKPYLEIDDDAKITCNKTRIVDGTLDDSGEGNSRYLRKVSHQAKTPLKKELQSIRRWLSDNDWKVNKVVIGEWSQDDERWISYLAERTAKRTRQDEILAILQE